MRLYVRIVTLVFAVAILASVPSAMAGEYATTSMGIVQFENGTTCPWDWPVCMENLNQTYGSEPWCDVTSPEADPFNYMTDGAYETDSDYFRVYVDSTNGKWHGETTAMKSDAWSEDYWIMVINITVSEVPAEPETFTKSLPLGWNLVSLPLMPTNNSTSAVLGNDTIVYDTVKRYNTATHQFEDAATMDPGIGYFVNVTTAGTWSYNGTACTSISATLSTGLNCVGWTNETGSALPGVLSSIAGSYRYVARWNAGTQSYEVYMPVAPEVFNDFDTMDRGEGYFIVATDGCTLE